MNATYQGQPVSFSADLFDDKGDSVGSVGQGGQLYAREAEDKGQLRVQWGEGSQIQCMVSSMLMPRARNSADSAIQTSNTVCETENS
ncbi:P pilus assembly protein%2C porin PapC [Yersinia intermedia]|uniref:P pilus assembly protein, porin PapC n=1 Tax=Yersinia intermedia TaxID=631 RepID=A0A0H5LZE8_YERIN|nr:FimD/PapC C-terminal domain-containing protein [Yersinia intermedia]CRY56564.1 P pilus assembly protein%2C porin PapC [Yersinia intermedia]